MNRLSKFKENVLPKYTAHYMYEQSLHQQNVISVLFPQKMYLLVLAVGNHLLSLLTHKWKFLLLHSISVCALLYKEAKVLKTVFQIWYCIQTDKHTQKCKYFLRYIISNMTLNLIVPGPTLTQVDSNWMYYQ